MSAFLHASVFFIELSENERNILNLNGWGSDVGQAYLNAKDGLISETNINMVKPAANLEFQVDPDNLVFKELEQIWTKLQNLSDNWSERKDTNIEVLTKFPRSMDVGDIVILSDGRQFRALSLGFVEGKWI